MRLKMYESIQGLCLRISVAVLPQVVSSLSLAATQPFIFKTGGTIQTVALYFSLHWSLPFLFIFCMI